MKILRGLNVAGSQCRHRICEGITVRLHAHQIRRSGKTPVLLSISVWVLHLARGRGGSGKDAVQKFKQISRELHLTKAQIKKIELVSRRQTQL